MNPFLNFPERFRRFFRRNGHADNLASRLFQPQNLRCGRLHIFRSRIGHRLNQDGISPADYPVAYFYNFSLFPVHKHPPFVHFPNTQTFPGIPSIDGTSSELFFTLLYIIMPKFK